MRVRVRVRVCTCIVRLFRVGRRLYSCLGPFTNMLTEGIVYCAAILALV